MNLLDRFRQGLARTRAAVYARLMPLLGRGYVDEQTFAELEELLLLADCGVEVTEHLIDRLREAVRSGSVRDASGVVPFLRAEVAALLGPPVPLAQAPSGPTVTLVVGVNGVGKTTTCGKLAARALARGQRALLGAADTFRAAAGEQLEIWANRVGAQLVRHSPGADPAAVAFDAVEAARARGIDQVILDTAGRLHNKQHLMAELGKIRRIVQRVLPGAPHEVLLVLDATTGQNAVQQARAFAEIADVTGICLTKLDSSAKGGVVLAVRRATSLPVKLVGLGEGPDDLSDFDPELFAEGLLGSS